MDELDIPPAFEQTITGTLNELPFVEWDRFYEAAEYEYVVFGWIDREDDDYKDYVQMRFWLQDVGGEYGYTYSTSSAEYTEKIADILGVSHADCNRVENHFEDVDNAINLGQAEGDSDN